VAAARFFFQQLQSVAVVCFEVALQFGVAFDDCWFMVTSTRFEDEARRRGRSRL
jgi:hypothetical protein